MYKYFCIGLMLTLVSFSSSLVSFPDSVEFVSKNGRIVRIAFPCMLSTEKFDPSKKVYISDKISTQVEPQRAEELLFCIIDYNRNRDRFEACVTVVGPNKKSVNRLQEKTPDLLHRAIEYSKTSKR